MRACPSLLSPSSGYFRTRQKSSGARSRRARSYHAKPHGVVPVLGYPMYFFAIMGFRKALGAIVILAPRYPRLKEWAYAGIFFDLTGAVASVAAVGSYGAYAFSYP